MRQNIESLTQLFKEHNTHCDKLMWELWVICPECAVETRKQLPCYKACMAFCNHLTETPNPKISLASFRERIEQIKGGR